MGIKETNNGKRGGLLKGKRHYDKDGKPLGGIKAVVTDTGKQVELEGGEVIINREASKKHWKTLSKINQSAGNGVPILPPAGATDTDPEEYKEGGNIIKFNPNHIPNKWILEYAKKIKKLHPKVWALGGNIFGNEAFENLKRVYERGYWLDSEEWMYIKWRSYVARHKKDFRIEGVIAMLKWLDKVDKGWGYMKQLIEAEITKKEKKPFGRKAAEKMKKGGAVTYKEKYNKRFDYDEDETHDLKEIAKDTGVSKKGLQAIYNKGVGAYKTNPESVRPTVKSKEQWAMGRVYSAVMGGKAARIDAKELKMANGGLIAPNGKPSNLTPEQWHLVRTPAFKAWFGDWENDPANASKVVDYNGEPLVCNHSSREENIDVFYGGRIFRTKKNEVKPIWFTYKEFNQYASGDDIFQYQCFLNIKNLFDYSKIEDVNILKKSYIEKNGEMLPDYDFDMDWDAQEQFDLPAYIYEMGYDGYKFTDEYSIVVFNSNQIKLADGTNTTFDGDNPDIRYATGGMFGNNCIDYINSHEAVLNNGYYCIFKDTDLYVGANEKKVPKIKSFCLVSYNSGGQKKLKVTDTINPIVLSDKLQKLIGGEKLASQVIIHEFIQNARRITKADLAEIAGGNIIIANRDTIECHNLPANKMGNGGGVDDFDWESLFNPSPEEQKIRDEEYKKSLEQEKEDWYKKSKFSKKWAATYQDAVSRTVKEYLDAKATYDDWSSRQYKSNKGTVFLGGDDVFGEQRSIGSINEGRRQRVLRGSKMVMDESIETLKELGLNSEEITNLIEPKDEHKNGGELAKGIKAEQEHIHTAEKLYSHKITPEQAAESIAKEHLAEDSRYYTKLAEMESKFEDAGAIGETPDYPANYKPIFWHLTKEEFCRYAENYKVDTRLDGTKARLECEQYYKYIVIKPLLKENAERNVFLLAVQTGQLPFEKVKNIIESAGEWDENNKFIKELNSYNNQTNVQAEIYKIPKDIYLQGDYFKNNFTKEKADKWYHTYMANNVFLNDTTLRKFIKKGIVKYSDVVQRLKEAGHYEEASNGVGYGLDKLKSFADTSQAKLKLKGLLILFEKKFEIEPIPTATNIVQVIEPLKGGEQELLKKLYEDNVNGVQYNKTKLEKLAASYGVTRQNDVKEIAELSISFVARSIARDRLLTPHERYNRIVKLYENQVNLSHRTSESILLQQYSTPAPIAFVAGLYCNFDEKGLYFEPSAGNGLLTIAGAPNNFIVNELDERRSKHLKTIGFKEVLKQDAGKPFVGFEKKFDAIITNPPFGKTEATRYGNSDIKSLEQVMALRALDTMKDNGRAAIIIGGHTEFDSEGRIKAGKNRIFFVYLYKHYNVMDVINISGRYLYSRQGTSFNVRLILIDGRKETPSGFPPLIEETMPANETNSPTPVTDFNTLWDRVTKQF